MQRDSAYVQTIAFFAQPKADIEVDCDANTSREEHDERLNRFWMLKALHRFPENHYGDEYQCNSVSEGSQDTHTGIAERLARIGGPFRLHNGKPCKSEREYIGNDVPGIGEQGKRIGNKTANEFCRQDQHGQKESQAQVLFCYTMCMIMPGMYI